MTKTNKAETETLDLANANQPCVHYEKPSWAEIGALTEAQAERDKLIEVIKTAVSAKSKETSDAYLFRALDKYASIKKG